MIHAAMKKQCCLPSLQVIISISQQDLLGQAESCGNVAVERQDLHWLVQRVWSVARMNPLLTDLPIYTDILSSFSAEAPQAHILAPLS